MFNSPSGDVLVQPITRENTKSGKRVDGFLFTGQGKPIIDRISQETGLESVVVLNAVINQLLVNKGADWTAVILSEYLGLFNDSLGTFSIAWDRASNQLVSHGAVFQSLQSPNAGLVAHIRTSDDFKTLGLGTLVTEKVTRAAFEQGASAVILATDDKLHRVQQGERAAFSMYSKIGYGVLAEKTLADTVDWLMIVDPPSFDFCQNEKNLNDGKYPATSSDDRAKLQMELISKTRTNLAAPISSSNIRPVSNGDIANLFLLLNLCPDNDFRCKLSAWNVQHGPEFERTYIVSIRPAIVDQDRMQDASQVLLDAKGTVVAICAANQSMPFTRQTMCLDFYCLPDFLESNAAAVENLIRSTISRIQNSSEMPRPCRLVFQGIDAAKITLLEQLGFIKTKSQAPYYGPDGEIAFNTEEYVQILT